MKKTLWTRNFTLVTAATVLGAAGGIAGGFALSFLVFDETGSTLASALILAMELIPYFLIPLLVAPWMDRMPRKPFLVGGDVLNGLLYGLAGFLECARTGGATSAYGLNYEFDAIASCVVGGVSNTGGIGTVPGMIVGVMIFGIINYGLTFIGVNPYWQQIIKGVIIIAAVGFDIRKNLRRK